MVGILVMLNNYMHDFATALVVVISCITFLMVKYVEKDGGREVKIMVVHLYSKMLHLAAGAFFFLILAGVVRTFTFKDFEWVDALGRGQVAALAVKHVILFALFGYAIYLWVLVHKKVRTIRKEIGRGE